MKIREVKIFNFGKLQNCTCRFGPGINVIYGVNEAGKSTLHAFLLAMLFGMEKNKGRAAAGDPYSRYEPWHAPSYYSGAMRLIVDRRPFYLERNFYYKEHKDILRNETDGEELSIPYGDLTMLLGGIEKETFANTYDIPQSGAVTGKELADILAEYLSDAAESGDGGTHVTKAVAALAAKRREKTQELKKLKEEKEQELNALQIEKKLLEQDLLSLREQIAQAEPGLLRMRAQRNTAAGQSEVYADRETAKTEQEDTVEVYSGKTKKTRRMMCFGGAGAAGAAILVQFALHRLIPYPNGIYVTAQVILAAVVICCIVAAIISKKKQSVKISKRTVWEAKLGRQFNRTADKSKALSLQPESETLKMETEAELQAEQMLDRMQELQAEKETRLYNIGERAEEILCIGGTEQELTEDIKALELAAGEIKRLAQELCEEVEDELNAEVSRWVSKITAGRYDSVSVDAKGMLKVVTEGREVPPESLSRGTLEQLYLALRISVGNIVTQEESMPLFLDEAFAMYDDLRLRETLKALGQMEQQIFLFTCQNRELEVLEQLGITYHRVNLE